MKTQEEKNRSLMTRATLLEEQNVVLSNTTKNLQEQNVVLSTMISTLKEQYILVSSHITALKKQNAVLTTTTKLLQEKNAMLCSQIQELEDGMDRKIKASKSSASVSRNRASTVASITQHNRLSSGASQKHSAVSNIEDSSNRAVPKNIQYSAEGESTSNQSRANVQKSNNNNDVAPLYVSDETIHGWLSEINENN